jgi:hypothetical protein
MVDRACALLLLWGEREGEDEPKWREGGEWRLGVHFTPRLNTDVSTRRPRTGQGLMVVGHRCHQPREHALRRGEG